MAGLTIEKVRNAKPAEKAYRMLDGAGLHLFVTPTGVKSWRFRHEVEGKEQTLVLGRYPKMTLGDARLARDAARVTLNQPPPPPPPPARPTFEVVAREWHSLNEPRWRSLHAAKVLASLEREVFPTLGATPIDQVTAAAVLAMLRPMELRGAVETARRIKQRCSAVFGFAIASSWAVADPTSALQNALAPLPPKGKRPALLTLDGAHALIRSMDSASGYPATRIGLRFLALTAVRPGEVSEAMWEEMEGLDTPEPLWRIPARRMKMGIEHLVPLTAAAIACLDAMRPLSKRSRYVFPNANDLARPMSDSAMNGMMIDLGWRDQHVPHGWRATFSSIMNERHRGDRQVIDLMLAHVAKDPIERAYNRAAHMVRRREIAEEWAGLLLKHAMPASDLVTTVRRR